MTPELFVAPSPTPSTTETPADRAYNLVGGVWSCETMTGLSLTHVYTLASADAIVMQSAISKLRKEPVDETYWFDRAHERWNVQIGKDIYEGSSGSWSGRRWTFDSPAAAKTRGRVSRLVYEELGDDAFRRDFQVADGGTWRAVLLETCRRTRKPTPAPSDAQ